MALGHLRKDAVHSFGTKTALVRNERAKFDAGAQGGSSGLPEFPRVRTNVGLPERTEGAHVQTLKSDLKRKRTGFVPFYLA